MALAGNLGCSSGSTIVGLVANAFANKFKGGVRRSDDFPCGDAPWHMPDRGAKKSL